MPNRTLKACTFLDKGGTGKTTSTAHLAVALSENGLDVLAIDLAGKQGDLTKHFGLWETVKEDDWPNIATVHQDQWDTIAEKLGSAAVDDLILETDEGVDLIPAHPGLDGLDDDLGNIDEIANDEQTGRYQRLGRFLDDYVDARGYDIVLIDLPGLTNNVSYNGLWAAKNVIAPVEMGPFEAEQADSLREDVRALTENNDIDIRLSMVLPNKVDTRTTLAEEYLAAFREEYPEAISPKHIPYSQDIRNATDSGHTAFALEEPSKTAERALDAYAASAEELVNRLEARA